jgi:hypothetical protein
MKILYFDCFAGASGDMILGALLALGFEAEKLIEQLKLLNIADFEIATKPVNRAGISSIQAVIKVPPEHAHRHLRTIEKIINESQLTESVKKRAVAVFTRLAEAEAKIHGIDVQKVHFHEVGAMDAIIDVVGACVGFDMLGIERFVCSKIHVGSGFVNMAHGKFPVPPPAVAELLKNAPVYSADISGELITPTAAAIISTVCDKFGPMPSMKIEKIGYGAGTREYKDFPNVLRLMLGETENKSINLENLILLETNLDDESPQVLAFVQEKAMILGALDCWLTPIQMKKSRPAVKISILCGLGEKEKLLNLLFTETTTLGIRESEIKRHALPREMVKVQTRFGEIDVKIARFGDQTKVAPEYEQCREAAEKHGETLQNIREEVLKTFKRQYWESI